MGENLRHLKTEETMCAIDNFPSSYIKYNQPSVIIVSVYKVIEAINTQNELVIFISIFIDNRRNRAISVSLSSIEFLVEKKCSKNFHIPDSGKSVASICTT